MMRVVDSMADRSRSVNGKPTSLGDIYGVVGLDDNWQDCGAGPDMRFNG